MKKLLFAVGVIFIVGFAIGSGNVVPDHAIVYGDPETKFYISPPCAMGLNFQESKESQIIYAYSRGFEYGSITKLSKLGYKPHFDCTNAGGFYEQGRSLSGKLLEGLGIIPRFKSRWNTDGSWNK